MVQLYTRVSAATPKIRVADPEFNADAIIAQMREAAANGSKLTVFPELVLTGYTCGDLFHQKLLLDRSEAALDVVIEASRGLDMVTVLGLPYRFGDKLYNTAAIIFEGRLLGIAVKKNLPNYSEFYEARWFTEAPEYMTEITYIPCSGAPAYQVPFGMNLLLHCDNIEGMVVAAELCEDVWVPCPPSASHALAGATVIVNCSASDETVGKEQYRRELIKGTSARLVCAYLYANAGEGESSQDLVFGAQNLIAENGQLLAESNRFETGIVYADLDLERITAERRRMTTFPATSKFREYYHVHYRYHNTEQSEILRRIDPRPFVPSEQKERTRRCEEILMIQSMGLKKRLEHAHVSSAVIGLSGGLDSTLALLVTVRAFDLLKIPREQICCVTMPCFGTTDRTYRNAVTLSRQLGTTLREIRIEAAVLQHFADIGHDVADHSVTYENSQARERTQVLMDLANQTGGIVIGTGDMSELALGWATYNGDHMSMYGVNAGVPKTLVRYLVQYEADESKDNSLRACLYDILDTPVSPELLPPEDGGEIAQKTEDLVGPYELHDFYLYQILRYGYTPTRIYRMALHAFGADGSESQPAYDKDTILKWLKVFYRRFFQQQFKRSCLPDGPKVGSAALSPRGDLRMPSDASAALWLKELDNLA